MEERVGDNGMDSIESTPEANRYSNYNTYLELKKLKYSDKKIASSLCITEENLSSIIAEFGLDNEE